MSINPVLTAKLILKELIDVFGEDDHVRGIDDTAFSRQIVELISDKAANRLLVEQDIVLFNDEDSGDDCEDDSSQGESHSSSSLTSGSEYVPSPTKVQRSSLLDYDMQTKLNIVKYKEKYGTKKTLERYSSLRNDHKKLARIIKSVEEEGSISEKRVFVRQYITKRFNIMRDKMATVHEQDLQVWALKAARSIGLENFTASRGYLHCFKKENRISSRKITKFYTRVTHTNEALILSAAREFVAFSQ